MLTPPHPNPVSLASLAPQVNFPALSLTEWHPFSVSSGPREECVELHIRALGDHTKEVVALSKKLALKKEQTWIRIDGPYGRHDFNYRRYPVVMLVGGGVGVTPVMGLLRDIYNVGEYSREEAAHIRHHAIESVYCCWVVPTETEATWFMRELKACMNNAKHIAHMPKLVVWIYVSRAKTALSPLIAGRPNMGTVFKTIEECNPYAESILCFACGPDPMINELWDLSFDKTMSGSRVDFVHETFNF